MVSHCSIYLPGRYVYPNANPFGKDIANVGLYRALARHLPGDRIYFHVHRPVDSQEFARQLLPNERPNKAIRTTSVLDLDAAVESGTLLYAKADLADLAWLRRKRGDAAYSLAGVVHTLAPPAVREYIAKAAISPVQPWDALICTSPSVQQALLRMLEEWCDYLSSRFAGSRRCLPQLPVIPLGVETVDFARRLATPGLRDGLRQRLRIADDDIVVLWVGRLSFFEKAFPQPMLMALEKAAVRTGRKLHFLMVGWFPNPATDRALYTEAAAALAPSVEVQFLDGNNRRLVDTVWAAADIFVSLVDNIQETFGIAPVEAMAAGLPVVVSDWDGYKFTVRHGIDGFRVPTISSPPGAGDWMVQRHALGMDTYQAYAGMTAQHVAINVGIASEALATLIENPELRRKMGAAAQQRARTTFDWAVVAGQIGELISELRQIRADARPFEGSDAARSFRQDPVKGDPFSAFGDFPSLVLSDDTPISLCPGVDATTLGRVLAVRLNRYASSWRLNPEIMRAILDHLADGTPVPLVSLACAIGSDDRSRFARTIVWMCKMNLVNWGAPAPMLSR
jgi:D-inositol-3-phosphate glycosyltransferase